MQLHILHITSNCSKLEVFTSAKQAQQRYDSFYDQDADPSEGEDPHWMQEDIHHYVADSIEEYRDVCTHIGEDPEYSLWFIEDVDHIVDYKHIHNYPQLHNNA